MNFYKQVIVVAIVILIISLSLIGTVLSQSKSDVRFPPNISECPDFYKKISDTECESTKNMYLSSELQCQLLDFQDLKYTRAGTGPNSGACEKKKVSLECGITWDGITNNSDVCYATQ